LKNNGKDVKDNMKYGSGSIKGIMFEDRVCLNDDAKKCVENFELIEIVESTGLSGIKATGLVGMSPKQP
tara:strand:+ start:184 stop:390 length:207 start_codon:yes stop_codon:yes gene_type:complete